IWGIIVFSLPFQIINAQYYVSATGSDNNPGTFQEAFKTIQKAAAIMLAGDTCFIREGSYRETVIPVSNGTQTAPIVFINYNNERVVILGSDRVTDWKYHHGSVYKAFVSDTVMQLFMNMHRAFPARYPDFTSTDMYCTSDWSQLTAYSNGKAVFQEMDKPENYWKGAYCKILTGHKWVAHVGKISASNSDSVQCDERSSPWNDYNPGIYLGKGKGYIFKHLHALDNVNEWHWQNDTLYYFPKNATTIDSAIIEARTRMYGFDCTNKSFIEITNIHFVWSSVNFSTATNCTIDGGSVWFPTPFFYFDNSWVRNKGGGEDYSIDHWAGKGIYISGSNNIVRDCYIAYSWGDGVSIGGIHNQVINCLIENCNWSATDAAAISATGFGHKIEGNTLRTAARSILVHRFCDSTDIKYNDLYNCGLTCDDLGLTYSYHTNGGKSEIAYNWVHDNHASGTASGIYLDNYDSNYVVHHNVVWNCAYAIQTNKPAVNHEIYNNTVWNCTNALWAWGREGTKVENQLVFNNLSDKPLSIGTVFKTNLTTSNPLFVDPDKGNFKLRKDSPAIDFGTHIPGITDDFVGTNPDAGAYEFGSDDWSAGSDIEIPDLSDIVIGSEIKPMPVVPSPSQLAYQEMEMIGFIHYSINTFTDKEWGYGDESPELFNPTELDAEQWAKTARDAGIKQLILTAKHHDGFCLWPSKYTEHSVKNSPWKNGKGDLVREFVDACHKYNLKVGLYLSPWDRNHKDYGTPEYITYYRNQLEELLTNYGKISEIWFDGANGGDGYYGGANEVRKIDRETYYNWDSINKLVLSLQPGIIIFSDKGPGCRWIGNEHGIAGETNWSTFSPDSIIIGASNRAYLNSGDPDGTNWVVGECDVSIRPGWFYHQSQDDKVKTLAELRKMYYGSVGRNGVLLLNLPPDRRGLIHENDVQRLNDFAAFRKETFYENLATNKTASASNFRQNQNIYHPDKMLDSDKSTYWALDNEVVNASAEIDLGDAVQFDLVVIS
ncbi:MAG: alpha-L-fucosidase, partial [Bacteroidales bacterium]|nr:alpha-L-fucosidase [Bacteroidales bacterium]